MENNKVYGKFKAFQTRSTKDKQSAFVTKILFGSQESCSAKTSDLNENKRNCCIPSTAKN